MDPFASPESRRDEEPGISQFPWAHAAPPQQDQAQDGSESHAAEAHGEQANVAEINAAEINVADINAAETNAAEAGVWEQSGTFSQPAFSQPAFSQPTFTQPTFTQPTGGSLSASLLQPAAKKPSLVPILAASLLAGLIGGVAGFTLAEGGVGNSTTGTNVTLPVIDGVNSARPDGSIASIAAAVLPTVVNIDVQAGSQSGTGSGSVIQSDSRGSYILTNNHVIAGGVRGGTITVTFQDRTTAEARIVGRDPSYDLAVLRIERPNLPTLAIGNSSDTLVGDTVVAIGSPLGLSGTVTSGIISALNRPVTAGGSGDSSYFSAIQTDAAINPGNSGGPLVNANGQMIGVNSAIATVSNTGESGSIGLGFAIPMAQATRVVEEIINTGKSTIPVIGVQLDSMYGGTGARVAGVEAGGPAAGAGLQGGDVITKVNGVPVVDSTEAIVSIRSNAPGDEVSVTVERGGREQEFKIRLGSRPSLQE